MALSIPREIEKELPPRVRSDLSQVDENKQRMFVDQYKKRSKNNVLMLALSIFFPIQLFLLGQIGLGIIFILTSGGLFIWWIIEIFMTPGRVKKYNEEIAEDILADVKIS